MQDLDLAYDQGSDAWHAGCSFRANPYDYDTDTDHHLAWLDGYRTTQYRDTPAFD